MAKYIDIDAVSDDYMQNFTANAGTYLVVRKILRSVPTADVEEVKHGEWIIDTTIEERTFYEVNYKILITCSICGNRHFLGIQPYRNFTQEDLKEDSYRKYRYCGQCGAKMDGGKKDDL